MLPSTQIAGEQQYLTVSNKGSDIREDSISEDQHPALGPGRLNSMFTEVSPFFYNDRARFSLEVRDEYKADFVLIRGLIEFQRPKELAFTYDREQKLIKIDIAVAQSDRLQSFLKVVFVSLRYERQFRIALKIALDFEKRYKLERESVYGILKDSSPTSVKYPGN